MLKIVNSQFDLPRYRSKKEITQMTIDEGVDNLNEAAENLNQALRYISGAIDELPPEVINYSNFKHLIEQSQEEIYMVIEKAKQMKPNYPAFELDTDEVDNL